MRNFKELKIWQKGFDIAIAAYKIISTLPIIEKFSLAQQISRSAVSISSNIAEGSSRTSQKDYNRFLEISLGSSFELETQLLFTKAVHPYSDHIVIDSTLFKIDEEQKMLMAFMRKINS
jgi:four helix bundle protein